MKKKEPTKRKLKTNQTAVCTCGRLVTSQVQPRISKTQVAASGHVHQGVNCRGCGALHIFSTEHGHVETCFRFIDLSTFYNMVGIIREAGQLSQLTQSMEHFQEGRAAQSSSKSHQYGMLS